MDVNAKERKEWKTDHKESFYSKNVLERRFSDIHFKKSKLILYPLYDIIICNNKIKIHKNVQKQKTES